MKKITIDELKEMLKKGTAPEEIIYNGCKYLKTHRENDYNNKLTGDNLSTKYFHEHYLTTELTDIEIPQPEILDSEEKEYLRNVIKPFRNEIRYINKQPAGRKREYIRIHFENDIMSFKSFEQDIMYKGMELYKKYTIEELGL